MATDFRFWDLPTGPRDEDAQGVWCPEGEIGQYEKNLILRQVPEYCVVDLSMCDGYNPAFLNHHHHLKREFEYGTGDCNGNDLTTFEEALQDVCLPEGDVLRLAVPFPAYQLHVFSALTMRCSQPEGTQADWELGAGIVDAADPANFIADITGDAAGAAATLVDGWVEGEYPHVHEGDLTQYTKPYATHLLYVDITKTPYLIDGMYKFIKPCEDTPCLMFDVRSVMLDTCGEYKEYSCRTRCCHPDWKCDPCDEDQEGCPVEDPKLVVHTGDGTVTGGEKKAAKKAAKKKAAKKGK